MRTPEELRKQLNELERSGDGSPYEYGIKQGIRYALGDLTITQIIWR